MASQIAHIIYDDMFFRKLDAGRISGLTKPLGKINREEFILGSTFPDIRRVDGNIKRKETHMHFPRIDLDFSGLNSFEAGWKFHLWCDMKREEILGRYNFYQLEGTSDFFNHPAKMLEDEIVYGGYSNWEKLSLYFQNPPFFSVLSGVSEDTYKLWYVIVSKYIEHQPDNHSMRLFLIKQPNLDAKVNMLMESIDKIRRNKKAVEILSKIKDEII